MRLSSTLVSTRSEVITAPSEIDSPPPSRGTTSETNFWPNSVVGRISTLTSSGTWRADSGSSARVMRATSSRCSMPRTCPTSAPFIRTSPNFASCRPARSASTTTVVEDSKTLA